MSDSSAQGDPLPLPLTMLKLLGSTHWKCRATCRMASRKSATNSVCLMFLAFNASTSSSPRNKGEIKFLKQIAKVIAFPLVCL